MKIYKMKSDVRTKVYNEYILTDDQDLMVAAILDSDLWERIVEVIAQAFKDIAEEEDMSIEEVVEDIIFNS
jgi:hypothetical protein